MAIEDLHPSLLENLKSPAVTAFIRDQLIIPAVTEALRQQEQVRKGENDPIQDILHQHFLRMNDLEQYSRKNCLMVNGVPEKSDESVPGLIMEIGRLIRVDITLADIDHCHRVGKFKTKTRPIIVKFVSFRKRAELYEERKTIRDANIDDVSCFTDNMLNNIYISDCLTQYNNSVMYIARELRRDKKLAAAWSDVGRMKVRLEGNGPTKIIRSLEDLKTLVGEHPAFDKFNAKPDNHQLDATPPAAGAETAPAPDLHSSRPRQGAGSATGRREAPNAQTPPPGASTRARAAGPAPASSGPARATPPGMHRSGGAGKRRGRGR